MASTPCSARLEPRDKINVVGPLTVDPLRRSALRLSIQPRASGDVQQVELCFHGDWDIFDGTISLHFAAPPHPSTRHSTSTSSSSPTHHALLVHRPDGVVHGSIRCYVEGLHAPPHAAASLDSTSSPQRRHASSSAEKPIKRNAPWPPDDSKRYHKTHRSEVHTQRLHPHRPDKIQQQSGRGPRRHHHAPPQTLDQDDDGLTMPPRPPIPTSSARACFAFALPRPPGAPFFSSSTEPSRPIRTDATSRDYIVHLGHVPLFPDPIHPQPRTPRPHGRRDEEQGERRCGPLALARWLRRSALPRRLFGVGLRPPSFLSQPGRLARRAWGSLRRRRVHPSVSLSSCALVAAAAAICAGGLAVLAPRLIPPLQPFEVGPSMPLQPETRFAAAHDLDVAFASVPRLLLLGGHVASANGSANTPPPPPPPFLRNSAGHFVPDSFFLQDLDAILPGVCRDLELIADHGPLSFRFTRGSSTQFRWSTSGRRFLPPHDALPTQDEVSWSITSPLPSTVVGLTGGEGSTAQPTARPPWPGLIFNLDPPLSRLCEDVERATRDVAQLDMNLHYRLLRSWIPRVERTVRMRLLRLVDIHQAHVHNASYGGSDQARLSSARELQQPRSTHTDITSAAAATTKPAVARPPRLARDTDGVPRDFSSAWAAFVTSRNAASTPGASPTSTVATTTAATSISRRNQTQDDLAAILASSLPYEPPAPPPIDIAQPHWAPEHALWQYRALLGQLRDAVGDLQQRVAQVTAAFPDPGGSSHMRSPSSYIDYAVWRTHSVAPFIETVVIPRLEHTASLVALAVDVLERSVAQYREFLPRPGEPCAPRIFPALRDLVMNASLVDSWLLGEEEEVVRMVQQDEEAFRATRYVGRHLGHGWMVASSWGDNDTRHDPYVTEPVVWVEFHSHLQLNEERNVGFWTRLWNRARFS